MTSSVTEAMTARVTRGDMPGLVTLVARGDDVEVDAIGAMAFEGEPMRRDTIFRITSLTKPITAAATMMLVDDGVLSLDEPVDRYLPELADRRVLKNIDGPLDETVPAHRPLTTDDLLTFRLGNGLITEPSFNPPYPINIAADELRLMLGPPDPRTPHVPDEWMRLFGSLPLMDQPGERWRYNTGTLVLGVLIARASGLSLGDFLKQRLFDPLGMTETGFTLPVDQAHRMPSHYMTNFETGVLEEQHSSPAEQWTRPPAFPDGSAGLLSTVDDYLAFGRMLLNRGAHEGKQLLSERSVELMTTNRLTAEQLAAAGMLLGGKGWGYGMSVATEPDDVSPVPGRYGWDGGYGTTWFNDSSQGLVAIALTQTSDFIFNGGSVEFARLVLQGA